MADRAVESTHVRQAQAASSGWSTSESFRCLSTRSLAAVADPTAGGTTVFIGTVRSSDDGRDVTSLRYEAHPDAIAVLHEVAEEVARKHHVVAVAAVHRTGLLAIGDLAVVVAVAAGHRGEAFTAGKELIDEVKARVPIWKQQSFADGAVAWVGIEATLDVEG